LDAGAEAVVSAPALPEEGVAAPSAASVACANNISGGVCCAFAVLVTLGKVDSVCAMVQFRENICQKIKVGRVGRPHLKQAQVLAAGSLARNKA
jgi:hypothetical protein